MVGHHRKSIGWWLHTCVRFRALRSLGLSDDLYEHRISPSSSSHRFTHWPSFAWRDLNGVAPHEGPSVQPRELNHTRAAVGTHT